MGCSEADAEAASSNAVDSDGSVSWEDFFDLPVINYTSRENKLPKEEKRRDGTLSLNGVDDDDDDDDDDEEEDGKVLFFFVLFADGLAGASPTP
ncbi:hypothetical protein M0802_008141 [Mischocyttarus mexicanus]|nr:hypothetical protein M0802_008141 [Mischocyttarus mexicanus]